MDEICGADTGSFRVPDVVLASLLGGTGCVARLSPASGTGGAAVDAASEGVDST